MEFIAYFFGILSVIAAMEQETFKLPPARLQNAQKFSSPCAWEYNLDPDVLKKVMDGTLLRDDVHKKYLHCFGLNGGFVDEIGHIVVARMVGLLEGHPRSEEFVESIKKCNEVTKENPVETTSEMNLCVVHTAPIRFVL